MTGDFGEPPDEAVAFEWASSEPEQRVLDAAHECMLRWGQSKVTIDDIVDQSGVSRATIYRLFPGGREILFEALRVRELTRFFDEINAAVAEVSGIEDMVVTAITTATLSLRADEGLIAMMAHEPGVLLGQLTMEGLPRIVRVANATLAPMLEGFVHTDVAQRLVDVLVRLTISYYLAPDDDIDLGNANHTRVFVRPILAALSSPDCASRAEFDASSRSLGTSQE